MVNLISTPEYPKSAVYWETSDPRTSVNIRKRSDSVKGARVVITGVLDTNSGINLFGKEIRWAVVFQTGDIPIFHYV